MCHNEFRLAKLAPGRGLRRLGWFGAVLVAFGIWFGPLVHGGADNAASIRVEQGWVRVLPGELPCAGYLVLENRGDKTVTLTGASSPAFGDVQIHESYATANGGGGMRQVRAVTVPAHGQVRYSPGGYHLMLMDRTRALRPGDAVDVTFAFADGRTCNASLSAKPANYEPKP